MQSFLRNWFRKSRVGYERWGDEYGKHSPSLELFSSFWGRLVLALPSGTTNCPDPRG